MTLNEFAEITRRVIARDGFDGYLPTAYFPARRHVAVLEGVPEGADTEKVALRWATDKADGSEEYLVAFRIDANRFKVVRRADDGLESAVFDADLVP